MAVANPMQIVVQQSFFDSLIEKNQSLYENVNYYLPLSGNDYYTVSELELIDLLGFDNRSPNPLVVCNNCFKNIRDINEYLQANPVGIDELFGLHKSLELITEKLEESAVYFRDLILSDPLDREFEVVVSYT